MAARKKISKLAQDYLWSESGGHCQNPACRRDLHAVSAQVSVSELAHIIPASPDGPRGDTSQHLDADQRAQADNILLLCPTCHTMIDKEPSTYPATLLHKWKDASSNARAVAFGTPRFETRAEARARLLPLLAKNHAVFEKYGPLSVNHDEDRAGQWAEQVRSTIIPANRQILAHVRANEHLLTNAELAVSAEFEIHASQLEDRHLGGNWSAGTLTYPNGIAELFEEQGE